MSAIEIWHELGDILSTSWARAIIIFSLSLLAAWAASRAVAGFVRRTTESEPPLILQRLVFYLVVIVGVLSALNQFGFDLGVLLGAAGVLTVAVGFAAQTSFSNIISGLFLIAERPFVVNDIVRVGTTDGRVHSIDMMSVTLRTFDNLFVRIPNEMIVKSEITNMSRFPIRRCDFQLRVAYDEDIERVYDVLRELAHQYPACLEEPVPTFVFRNFGPSSLEFQFSIWATQADFYNMRNELPILIRQTFEDKGIRIPFPKSEVSVDTGTSPEAAAAAPQAGGVAGVGASGAGGPSV